MGLTAAFEIATQRYISILFGQRKWRAEMLNLESILNASLGPGARL